MLLDYVDLSGIRNLCRLLYISQMFDDFDIAIPLGFGDYVWL